MAELKLRALSLAKVRVGIQMNGMNDTWDSYDTTFEDEIFELDGSTISLELAAPLASATVYNVYLNGVRVDDVNLRHSGTCN